MKGDTKSGDTVLPNPPQGSEGIGVIRLDTSSSNFPRFDMNPNTGEPLDDNRRVRIAENTIYRDAQHPSHILLLIH